MQCIKKKRRPSKTCKFQTCTGYTQTFNNDTCPRRTETCKKDPKTSDDDGHISKCREEVAPIRNVFFNI